uniref:Uncharacterized protein n=1 Tax=Cacopsylla melanoneura TaxID=428564 RepID=A0A8D9E6Q6_9HEMI
MTSIMLPTLVKPFYSSLTIISAFTCSSFFYIASFYHASYDKTAYHSHSFLLFTYFFYDFCHTSLIFTYSSFHLLFFLSIILHTTVNPLYSSLTYYSFSYHSSFYHASYHSQFSLLCLVLQSILSTLHLLFFLLAILFLS